MISVHIRALLVLSLCALPFGARAQESPYGFRNIDLGITSVEFKKRGFPDLKKWPKVIPVCTGDAKIKKIETFVLGALLREAGVTQCGYLLVESSIGPLIWSVDFAGIGNYQAFYLFSPASLPESQRGRLYHIEIKFPVGRYAEVLAAYTTKYGQPKVVSEKYKVQSGAEFDNSVSVWENTDSSITLSHYGSSLTSSNVVYLHKQLLLATDAAFKNVGKKGAGQL